ncbi:hypothetical protein CAAN3_01S00254 [[Candida] anglica]
MADSSRTINHKLNDLLSKNNISKNKLDATTALSYASVLKANILGKDKQEKVNSIVVLAKLLDCIVGGDAVSNDFTRVLDHTLFSTLFSIVSPNMSTETYKAILKIAVILISGTIFKTRDDESALSIDKYLPLYECLIEYLDVLDIMTSKLYLQDNKITYNSIKLVSDLINKALKHEYNGIITLAGRLKHVAFFSTVGNLIDTDDRSIIDGIHNLKISYYNLNEYLNRTHFDLSIKSHQVMLTNLFIFLEVSLNEFGTVATTEEYIKAGFTADPKQFVVDNFTVLLAMDLKIFLKDPNMTFKKRFHEELMMSNHNRTFPLNLFIEKVTDMWMTIFHQKEEHPTIYDNILSWELMIFYTMNNCLILWQDTKANLENDHDIDRILQLLISQVPALEVEMASDKKSVEECLNITATNTSSELRHNQIFILKKDHENRWKSQFTEFNRDLSTEVMDFVCEQRVIQLLKGSWVHTEAHGEQLLKVNSMTNFKSSVANKFYFIMLSPNRKYVYYKEFPEKTSISPSYEEMESQSIRLMDIQDFKSTKLGEQIGAAEKPASQLVTIKGTISYEKITLLGENNRKLLSFYTDTEVSKYVWLDGLKMLRGMIKKGQLSQETEKQLQSLVEIRRNAQLLSLEDQKFGGELNFDTKLLEDSDADEDDDEEFYDLDELVSITTDGFYYK